MCFPKVPMRFTQQNVRLVSLPAGKAELLVFDDDLPGFGVRLRGGGKRTWIVQYRIGEKQRRVSLGRVEALDADKARREAKNVLSKANLGTDTQVERRIARTKAAETLGLLVERYLTTYAELNMKPRSYAEVKRSLKSHWKPLHEVPVASRTRASVSARLAEIAKSSGPVAANRARAYLSAFFSWAMEQGQADDSPVRGTGLVVAEKSRDRVLSDAEIALVWACAGHGEYAAIVKLLALTGQRREEVAGMRWSEIDLPRALWSIAPSRTKNGLPHDVPLSDVALEIMRGVNRREDRDLVFGSRQGPFSGWSKSKAALDERMLIAVEKTDPGAKRLAWRLHDLRRTAATRMADLGVQPHVIEAILNHISGSKAGVAGIYNRATYSAEKRAALDLWDKHIQLLTVGRS